MSWFDTAREMLGRTTLEVTVKNSIAQITKEFYGYGPRIAVRCMVHGPLILHATPASGAGIMHELATLPAGQVVMDYNNRLLVERYRDRLAELTRLALRTDLAAMFCDFDPAARLIIGGALVGRPLNRAYRPAEPPLLRAVRDAVGALGGPGEAEVWVGAGCFWTHLPAAGWAPAAAAAGAGAEEVLTTLARWRRWRDRVTARLLAGCAGAGVTPAAAFVGADGEHLVLGGIQPA